MKPKKQPCEPIVEVESFGERASLCDGEEAAVGAVRVSARLCPADCPGGETKTYSFDRETLTSTIHFSFHNHPSPA